MRCASKGERSGEIVAWEQFSVKKFFWPRAISAVAGSFDCVRLAPYFAQDDKGSGTAAWMAAGGLPDQIVHADSESFTILRSSKFTGLGETLDPALYASRDGAHLER